jgi:cytochrome b6-f complex iron-sulfur subunit
MADKKKMSVEEMLAAARAERGGAAPSASKNNNGNGSASDEPVAAPPAAVEAASETPAPAKPAPAAKKPTAGMSVAEMLAAARGEAGAAKKPAAAAPAAPAKPAAPAANKPAAKTAAAEKPAAGPVLKDTASILAAARRTDKPGPVSKAELTKTEALKPAKTKLAVPPMPEKPGYARPEPAAPAPAGVPRRGFLAGFAAAMAVLFQSSLAIGFTSMGVTGVLWVLGLARFMFPNVLIEPPTKFKVGFPDDYGPGQVQTKFIPQFGVWIVRYEWEGQSILYALKAVCTHLGCTPSWLEGEQKFKCPCHGSGFYKDGVNFEGPAPRPLERYAISRADDGQLEVDKSRTFQEELGQWKDTASYVPV